jgi:hypothetical protein
MAEVSLGLFDRGARPRKPWYKPSSVVFIFLFFYEPTGSPPKQPVVMQGGEREDAGPRMAQTGPDGKTGPGCVWGTECSFHDQPGITLQQCSLRGGVQQRVSSRLAPVQPKDALAGRMAAAHEHEVLHVPSMPVISVIVYNQPVPRHSLEWCLERVARNNPILVAAQSNADKLSHLFNSPGPTNIQYRKLKLKRHGIVFSDDSTRMCILTPVCPQ